VRQIAEMGAYVKLLEYDNIEGMILLSELSRRRIRSIQKLIRVGRNEVVVVLRVDKEKGYIDLSKRRVSPEDMTKCEDRYMKSKTVASILRHVASKVPSSSSSGAPAPQTALENNADEHEEEDTVGGVTDVGHEKGEEVLEMLYENIAWPLGRKYGHPHDAFKFALTEPDEVFKGLEASPEIIKLLMATVARRLTPQPIKLRADIELTCFKPAGIDAIKRALNAGEAASTATVPIKAKLVAPPFYVLDTNATDKHAGVETLEAAIGAINRSISSEGGELNVKMKPKAVSETDDMELAALMARATKENAQVSGDEDDSEPGEDEI